ncbi:MAG: hypothetical protein Q9159_001692 [Coniocarpon cinnabarinum]
MGGRIVIDKPHALRAKVSVPKLSTPQELQSREVDNELFTFPEVTRFIKRHVANYKPMPDGLRPFDKLPNEILDTILTYVATSNANLEHDFVSPHIFKARLLQKRITKVVDHFLQDYSLFGRSHYKNLPGTSRELRNFLAASRNPFFADKLTEIYLPVQLQATDLHTASTWHRRFACRPDRPRHTKWAYLYESYPSYPAALSRKASMVKALHRRDRSGYSVLGSALRKFRNLRSLKVRTLPAPTLKMYDSSGTYATNPQSFFHDSNYQPLISLFSLFSAAQIPLTHLHITGLAPALLEDAFAAHLPTWTVLDSITHLHITLLDGEDYTEVPADVLIAFLAAFHSLQHLELSGIMIDRRAGSEYCVEQIVEIYAMRPRTRLRSLKLRSVTCHGWALEKLLREHERTIAAVHLDDVHLSDSRWFSLIEYMRRRTERGVGWEKVVLRQSKDRWNDGLDAFWDENNAAAMSDIVAKHGDGEGYNVARMELSKYITHVRPEKETESSSEGERSERSSGTGEGSDGTSERVVYDPNYG